MSVAWVLLHGLAMVLFVNRYIGGMALRVIRRKRWDETVDDYVPTVTVVIPLFNEGAGIAATLSSVLDSDYPADRLRAVCIDDCSSDDSYERACDVARTAGGRLAVIRNAANIGKRGSIIGAVREATSEIIVSVDSDVVIDRRAIRELVRRFTSPRVAAVGGWVDIRNKHDNWLTRMQVIKYWYAYFVMRNIEWAFRRMLCLSGCLTAYRRSVLLELEPVLASRAILGAPIKYGEDRFLTRQMVKAGYLTTITLDARCWTDVPRTLPAYFSQQLRWRRSNIVDYAGGFSHIWRLNPLIAINYFAMFIVLFGYPIAVARALAAGAFFPAVLMHVEGLFLFGMYYRWRVRSWPREHRVSGLSFIPQALVMPITYALLTPLALFTLDSTSWETRGHDRLPDRAPAHASPAPRVAGAQGR
jgi:cellulose synthase/poly-beta-1,6-N-acetylglucosamine synthase-like glycosyltransferase